MRAGPAFLQFDWLKAGLGMDLLVFVYSHTKDSFQDREDVEHVVKDLLTSNHAERTLQGFLFCVDLSLLRSTDRRGRNLHYIIISSPHAVRPTSSFDFSFESKHVDF